MVGGETVVLTMWCVLTQFCSQKNKVLVFFSTQASVEFHHELLQSALFDEEADDLHGAMTADILLFKLHGDMLQKVRTCPGQAG